MLEHIIKPLIYIFNLANSEGVFPMHFKKAIIIPTYKSGDKKLTTNYRPISLTSNIAKIFEKILKIRLVNYITKFNLISYRQFGLQTGISTNDAIAYVTNYIYEKLDQSLKPLAIFLDMTKAFDTVSHRILLDKLEALRIRGLAHKMLSKLSYG